mmetsp:Transcript_15429/g.39213  ORF Transcript_15429/g.39213 Transcript_15429/m.39213 type:complete len:200 (-) Transcript_15429:439-1038(-)
MRLLHLVGHLQRVPVHVDGDAGRDGRAGVPPAARRPVLPLEPRRRDLQQLRRQPPHRPPQLPLQPLDPRKALPHRALHRAQLPQHRQRAAHHQRLLLVRPQPAGRARGYPPGERVQHLDAAHRARRHLQAPLARAVHPLHLHQHRRHGAIAAAIAARAANMAKIPRPLLFEQGLQHAHLLRRGQLQRLLQARNAQLRRL